MSDTRNADLTFGAVDFIAYVAPRDTAAPVGFADPAGAWKCAGWVTTAGGTFAIADEKKDVQAAGSLEPIRTLMTRSTKTMKAVYQEALNPVVRSLYDNVPLSALNPTSGIVSYNLPDKPADLHYAFVFDTMDGLKRNRFYMPNGMVTERGDEQAQTDDVWPVEMTFTFYKGAALTPAVHRTIDYGGVDVSGFFA
ncbi:phage tail protein [Kitasatospora sp. NPDC101183]|uniref:phage tail tube protein n=1 Tax=Kitasatospora sp. NPDC101183 TaxID=3364100 RepID=UPI0038089203